MHRNKSDIIHYFHLGGAIRYTTVTEQGVLRQQLLGANLDQGYQLQMVVPGGVWKAAELCEGDYGLISEVVTPGFEYADNEIASKAHIQSFNSEVRAVLEPLVR